MAVKVDGELLRRTAETIENAFSGLGKENFRVSVTPECEGSPYPFWDIIFRKATCQLEAVVEAAQRLHGELKLHGKFNADDVWDEEDGTYSYYFDYPEEEEDYEEAVAEPEPEPEPPEMTLEQLLAIKSKSTNDTAYLVFAYEFFDEIYWGEKTIEYRYLSEYYAKKLISHPIKYLKCNRGYGHPGEEPLQMIVEVKDIRLANGDQDEIGLHDAVPEGFTPELFAIHLGKVVSCTGIPPKPSEGCYPVKPQKEEENDGADDAESESGWATCGGPCENYEGMPYDLTPIANIMTEVLARHGVEARVELFMEFKETITACVHHRLEDLLAVYDARRDVFDALGVKLDDDLRIDYYVWQQKCEFFFDVTKQDMKHLCVSCRR